MGNDSIVRCLQDLLFTPTLASLGQYCCYCFRRCCSAYGGLQQDCTFESYYRQLISHIPQSECTDWLLMLGYCQQVIDAVSCRYFGEKTRKLLQSRPCLCLYQLPDQFISVRAIGHDECTRFSLTPEDPHFSVGNIPLLIRPFRYRRLRVDSRAEF